MELHYRELGEGEPLIILHGLFGMLDNWMTLARRFAENYRVIVIDQRNHGQSPHSEDFDYYLLAEDLLAFIEAHELEQIHLLGHSMGGKTAMQFAVDNPEYVQSLIVVDIAPKDYPPGHEEVLAAFETDISQAKSRKEVDALLEETLPDFGVRQFILKNLKRSKEGPYYWKANHEAISAHYYYIIQNSLHPTDRFEGRTLFIKGGNSERYITDSDIPAIKKYFPQSEMITIEGAGHWVHAEKPMELLSAVNSFLSTN